MKTLKKSITESLANFSSGYDDSHDINESAVDNTMLEIRNTSIESSDDFELAYLRVKKIPDTDLLKFTEEFFWMLIHEVGTDIQNESWYKQSNEDVSLAKITKGISIVPGYHKHGFMMYPEGYDETGMEVATVRGIGVDKSRKVNVLALIEHPGGKQFIHSFPLKEVIKNPGKKFKIPGAISEYVIFIKNDVVDIIVSAISSYFAQKEYESKKHRKSSSAQTPVQTPVQTPKSSSNQSPTQTQQLYTSIQQFKRDFPKKTIYDLFKNHIDSGRVGRNYSDRNIFNRELFDNQEHELGNSWNSYVTGILVESPSKIYFDIYVQGDSTDDNELISYDEFTQNSGSVIVKSQIARQNAMYDERTRLKILNKIAELLSDAVDGNKVFI